MADTRTPTYISGDQAAEVAGVTRRTINRWVADTLLTTYREQPGNLLRIDLDELEAFLGIAKQPSADETTTGEVTPG